VSSRNEYKIVVANVNSGLSEENILLLNTFSQILEFTLEVVVVNFDLDLQVDSNISIAAYGRLFLMESLEENFLYLDSDTVVHVGWEQVYSFLGSNSQEKQYAVAATIEPRSLYYSNHPNNSNNLARRKALDTYIFSGILLVDVSVLKQLNFANVWREAAKNSKEYGFVQHDQDILNYVLANRVKPFPSHFNHLHGTASEYPRFFSSCIGRPKPWTVSREDQTGINLVKNLHS
jgi:lipopolysaccharide biosynthesis glycosyltransferase